MTRGIYTIPGHAAFGVIMGAKYGEARCVYLAGSPESAKKILRKAWLYAALAHGAFNLLLMQPMQLAFIIYLAGLIVLASRLAINGAKTDHQVNPQINISTKKESNNG